MREVRPVQKNRVMIILYSSLTASGNNAMGLTQKKAPIAVVLRKLIGLNLQRSSDSWLISFILFLMMLVRKKSLRRRIAIKITTRRNISMIRMFQLHLLKRYLCGKDVLWKRQPRLMNGRHGGQSKISTSPCRHL